MSMDMMIMFVAIPLVIIGSWGLRGGTSIIPFLMGSTP